MKEVLEKFKEDLTSELPGLFAFAITEIETGISYLTYEKDENFNVEIIAGYNLEVYKAKIKAVEALKIKKPIDDILITFEDQFHLIDVSDNNLYFIYLAIDSTKSNLGITKSVLRKYKEDLKAVI